MESRIEERRLDLFADRTSAHNMRANRLRRRFASMAHVLLCALRRLGLARTRLAAAAWGSLPRKLVRCGSRAGPSNRRRARNPG